MLCRPLARVLLLVAALAAAGPARAAVPAETPSAAMTDASMRALADEIASRRAALKDELEALRRRLEAAAEGAAVAEGSEQEQAVKRQVELLQRLDWLFRQQLSALDAIREQHLEQTRAAGERRAGDGQDLREPGPYALPVLDRARDAVDAAQSQAAALETEVGAAEAELQEARARRDDRERIRRAAKEAVQIDGGEALERALGLAELESRVAGEEERLLGLQLESRRLALAAQAERVATLRARAERIAAQTQFDAAALEAQQLQLEQEEFDLGRAVEVAKAGRAAADARMAEAGGRSGSAMRARALAQQTSQAEVASLDRQMQRIGGLKEVWNRRFALASGRVDPAALAQWQAQATRTVEQLAREERVQVERLRELRKQAQAVRPQRAGEGEGTDVARELDRQADVAEADLASLEKARHLHERLLHEIDARRAGLHLGERAAAAWSMLRMVWSYELGAVDDRPVTVGKIAIGLLLFGAGLSVAGLLSRALGTRVLPRLGLDTGAAAAVQSVSFYVLVSMLALLALHVINIPLTVFTFVGGALAIGVGFGSQNIVNNFISGLIMLAERPIKVGDLIEVDGTSGTVERVGPRSTRVRSSEGIHIIVPNSAFLDKNVVNWTLADDHVRVKVAVGVAYGAPTVEVARILRQAVDEHEKILAVPEPIVLFAEFGESSLNFEVHFWMRVRSQMDRRRVESDLRYRIDALFHTAGISIAFPQRDVHIDMAQPLAVRLIDPGSSRAEPGMLPRFDAA